MGSSNLSSHPTRPCRFNMSTIDAYVSSMTEYIATVELAQHGSDHIQGRVPRATAFVDAGAIQLLPVTFFSP